MGWPSTRGIGATVSVSLKTPTLSLAWLRGGGAQRPSMSCRAIWGERGDDTRNTADRAAGDAGSGGSHAGGSGDLRLPRTTTRPPALQHDGESGGCEQRRRLRTSPCHSEPAVLRIGIANAGLALLVAAGTVFLFMGLRSNIKTLDDPGCRINGPAFANAHWSDVLLGGLRF